MSECSAKPTAVINSMYDVLSAEMGDSCPKITAFVQDRKGRDLIVAIKAKRVYFKRVYTHFCAQNIKRF